MCGDTPPTLDDSVESMHGCFMYCFSLCVREAVCKKPYLPPGFRFTTGRGGLGIFQWGEGMRDCRRLQGDMNEPLRRAFKKSLLERKKVTTSELFWIVWIKKNLN